MQIKIKKQQLDDEFLRKQELVLKDIQEAQKYENVILNYEVTKTWFGGTDVEVKVPDKYARFFWYWGHIGKAYEQGCVGVLKSFVRLPHDKEIVMSEAEWFSLENNIKWYDKYLGENN